MSNEKLQRAKDAIQAVFGDTSKDPEDTYAELGELKDEIEQCMSCLEEL